MFLAIGISDIAEAIAKALFPFLNPILKFVENQADNIHFASDTLLDILKTLSILLNGSALPFYLTMSFSIVLTVYVVRFILLR